MQHSFDVELAKEYGILEAILMQNIYFWIEKNRVNNKHFYDGRHWTYNSKKAFSDMFPYATERQIKYSLEKLIKTGILITGNYNKQWSDRTLWYAFSDIGLSIVQKSQMQQTKLSNESGQNCPMTTDKNVQPIPYINTYINTDNNTPYSPSKKSEKKINEKLFKIFWEAYPKKQAKGNAEKWFEKNRPSEELVDMMISKLILLKNTKQWQKNNGQFIPYPSTWLNAKGWEDEISDDDISENDEEEIERLKLEIERRKANGDW